MKTVEVEVTGDFICPWCLIAEARLERAISLLPGDAKVIVRWKPLELNPRMPTGGMDRREYRSRKFGKWERSQEMDAHTVEVGKSDGLAFNYGRITRTPNTHLAHRLAWYSERHGRQREVVAAIYRAYFEEGRDIGKLEELIEVARAVGLDAADVTRFLSSDEGSNDVQREQAAAAAAGIHAVPTLRIGKETIGGAVGVRALERSLRNSLDAREEARP